MYSVIFDFDGVIIDSRAVQEYAFERSYMETVGKKNPPVDVFLRHSGNSLPEIFALMNLPSEMMKLYIAYSIENVSKIKVFEGMPELIKGLRKQGIKCGLCTGKERSRTIDILNKLELIELFDTVVCSDDVKRPKPYPDSLLLAVKNIKADIVRTIMIGDSKNDVLSARHAGIRSIAVTWGIFTEEILRQYNPDEIATKPTELAQIIQCYCSNVTKLIG